MGESFCDVCGERWGIPTPAHECKVVPPMRDTATLLELLEAEERFWTGALSGDAPTGLSVEEHAAHYAARSRVRSAVESLGWLIDFYREEASRGTP